MRSKVAEDWLAESARTANIRDYAAHMDLISRNVQVHGVPGFDVLGYDDWARQCRHEFETGVLKAVRYDGCKVRVMTPGRVMFKTVETVEGTDGTVNVNPIEVLLEKESDGKWRVVQERIITSEEYDFEPRSGAYAP